MGSSPQTIKSSNQYVPSEGEQPSINAGMQQMLSLFQNPQSMYPGQTFVGASPYTQGAIGGIAESAPQLYNQSQQFANSWNRGLNASDVANNPYVQNQMSANASRVNDNLQRNIMPGIQQGAIQGGGMNSARQGIAQGVASGDASESLANANAGTMLGAYGQGLSHESNMMGQSGNLMSSMGAPWQALQQAGSNVESYQGKALQDAMSRYGYGNQQANTMLDQLIGRLGGMRYGTNVGEQVNPNYQSPFESGMKIAAGIGSAPMTGGGSVIGSFF